MLAQVLNLITPEMLTDTFKSDPGSLTGFLNKFSWFKALGGCLAIEQQVFLSSNVGAVETFLTTKEGKDATQIWITELIEYVKKPLSS